MFCNKKEKEVKKEVKKLPKVNVHFVNINKITTVSLSGKGMNRLMEFANSFLDGVASTFGNCVKNPKCYIHGIDLATYNSSKTKVNERSYIFTPPLTEFEMPCKDNFFEDSDYALISLYICFNENHEYGLIIHIKVDF